MVLAGLCFVLAGGCPGRQIILAGEGDGDSAVFVLGMIVGAGFAHNFGLASSGKGPGAFGPAAVIIAHWWVFRTGIEMTWSASTNALAFSPSSLPDWIAGVYAVAEAFG